MPSESKRERLNQSFSIANAGSRPSTLPIESPSYYSPDNFQMFRQVREGVYIGPAMYGISIWAKSKAFYFHRRIGGSLNE